ncbi:hypothetical protein [Mycobacterium sp. IS-3022]|uniref:hypothetical protein n=1 Tax=Mycobacterium sp. IS-3022 TaxID=1772277 RepID=UPI0007415103|nr:hypothetical protein AU188_11770 [Mycobacterium sp. IS-3022]
MDERSRQDRVRLRTPARLVLPDTAAAKLGMTLGRPLMAWMFQKFLYNLRDYSAKRFTTA